MTDDTGSDIGPMDFGRIQDTSDGDKAFEQELFEAYIGDCKDRFARLRAAASGGDGETFRREAHTVKGASANVGTTYLHTLARELELVDLSNGAAVEALIAKAEAEFERVVIAINEYLDAA